MASTWGNSILLAASEEEVRRKATAAGLRQPTFTLTAEETAARYQRAKEKQKQLRGPGTPNADKDAILVTLMRERHWQKAVGTDLTRAAWLAERRHDRESRCVQASSQKQINLCERLQRAAGTGKLAEVKKLCKKKKVNPNMMLPGGCHFPLLVAVQESNWTPGNLKCIQWLIEKEHADPRLSTIDRGITPLLRACHSGIVEAVEYLLQVAPEGAWLDYSDSGMNALQYALDCAFPTAIAVMNAVLDTLRAHPGRATDAVSHVNERGWTVVHMAATAGRIDVLQLLYDQSDALGLDVLSEFTRLDASHFTPLNCAEHAGYQDVVNALVRWIDNAGGDSSVNRNGHFDAEHLRANQIEAIAALAERTCSVCCKIAPDTVKRCPRCGVRQYCSVECQKVDWADGGHRAVCKGWSGGGGGSRRGGGKVKDARAARKRELAELVRVVERQTTGGVEVSADIPAGICAAEEHEDQVDFVGECD